MNQKKMIIFGMLLIAYSGAIAQELNNTVIKVAAAKAALAADLTVALENEKKSREALVNATAATIVAREAVNTAAITPPVPKVETNSTSNMGAFGNLTAGIGVFSLGKKGEVVDATIENGIVRVKEKRSMRAGPWLQTTWIYDKPEEKRPFAKFGIFLGAELGGDNLVKSVGTGVVLQLRRLDETTGLSTMKGAINIGIGVHWTTIQVLGSGLVENSAVPVGTESIRYRKESQPGAVINVSFGF